ncbi:MAG: fructosamine kinase family protein [Saprospiraceae bacterium]|nr:fructosamine kinase family protein [Saprospiraceae bacterium]
MTSPQLCIFDATSTTSLLDSTPNNSMLPSTILQKCLEILGADIRSARPVTGGDINQAILLETSAGQFFLKINPAPTAGSMFEAEAAGLALLASANAIRTPAVIGFGDTPEGGFLLLEYIETDFRPLDFWEKFGCRPSHLAPLHRSLLWPRPR